MDNKAMYTLSYGIFVLGTSSKGKANACITNTCIQVASNPLRVAISVLNQNLTCDLIKESGHFALSVLDNTTPFSLIEHFGFVSGRNKDKLSDFDHLKDSEGCPYIKEHAASFLSCKVLSKEDLGSHTLFIAEVMDAQVLSGKESLTYSYYQSNIKPKTKVNETKKIIGWRCKICGYEYMESELPEDFTCPLCEHPRDDFEPIYEK